MTGLPFAVTAENLLAWGIGAGVGYGFATRTALRAANIRIDELKTEVKTEREDCHAKIEALTARIQSLEDQRFDIARGKE